MRAVQLAGDLQASRERLVTEARAYEEEGLFPKGSAEIIEAKLVAAESIEAAVADADYIAEVVSENLAVKEEVLGRISSAAPTTAIVTSNTSATAFWKGKEFVSGQSTSRGYKDYDGLGWTVLVRQPTSVAFADADALRQTIFIAGLIASLITAVLGWLLAKLVTRPLLKITRAAQQMQEDPSKSLPNHHGIREIETLTDALQQLIHRLLYTEQEKLTFERLSQRDSLTGLANRNGLAQYIEQLPAESHAIYLCLDLDGFKAVNDTYGHALGDLLLIEVGQRLEQLLPPGGFVARLGGDEFIIVLTTQSLVEARYLGEQWIAHVSMPYHLEEQTVQIGMSIGLAEQAAGESLEQVMHRADLALYRSKQNGRGCISVH